MKNQEKLNHPEIMDALSGCFRELIATDITHRNMPNIINRGKAAAQLVTAMHREQIMESRRQSTQQAIAEQQQKKLKK
jgi:hypothetical protein